MAERIHELLLRNLQEVFGEGDPTKRRSAIKEPTRMTVCYMSPQVPSLGTMPSINLQATCALRIPTSPTRPMLLPKLFRTPGA
jgi:hypothetical protein